MDLGNEIGWRRIEFVQLGKVIRQQRQNNLVKISLFLKIDLPKKCGQPLFPKQPLKHTHTHNNVCPSSFPFVCKSVVVVANVSRALIFSQDSSSHKSGGGVETIAIIPIAGYI